MKEFKVAIIGYGGIARQHYAGYCALAAKGLPIRVVAVCDKNTEGVFKPLAINLGEERVPLDPATHVYSEVDDMIASEEFDMADICLPTFLHPDMSIKLLRAGKHVMCEKPMALTGELCDKVLAAAKEEGKWFRVAQCMRYSPFYLYLRDCIRDGRYGKLGLLKMHRLCHYPSWAADFKSMDKTGGMLLDTAIHDVDLARMMLGTPKSARSVVYRNIPLCQRAESVLTYEDTAVCIETAWDDSRPEPFSQGYRAYFEDAVLVYCDNSLILTRRDGTRRAIDLNGADVFAEEIFALYVDIISGKAPEADDAAESIKIIEALEANCDLITV